MCNRTLSSLTSLAVQGRAAVSIATDDESIFTASGTVFQLKVLERDFQCAVASWWYKPDYMTKYQLFACVPDMTTINRWQHPFHRWERSEFLFSYLKLQAKLGA